MSHHSFTYHPHNDLDALVIRPVEKRQTFDPSLYKITPMGTLKLFLSQLLIAAAATLSESEQWRLFGGLLAGGVGGGLCGMLLAALTAKPCSWQVYAARFAANTLGALGLGSIALLIEVNAFGVTPGPLLTVANGFVFGLVGVAAFLKTLEPVLLRRIKNLADGAGEEKETRPHLNSDTVNLTNRD